MSYAEQRVRVKKYGTLRRGSPMLVPVPTAAGYQPQVMHYLAAADLVRMSAACEADTGEALLVASGWRPHRWESREEYERVLVAKYGSVERGRLWLAFDSPHETGLVCDFHCGGLAPVSATAEKQRLTKVWRWLHDHASEFGFHPYLTEPWHWEHQVPLDDYLRPPAGA